MAVFNKAFSMNIDSNIVMRQMCNYKIIERLKELVDKYPQQRFGQILYNYILEHKSDGQLVDPFYEESFDMINRINKFLYENNI